MYASSALSGWGCEPALAWAPPDAPPVMTPATTMASAGAVAAMRHRDRLMLFRDKSAPLCPRDDRGRTEAAPGIGAATDGRSPSAHPDGAAGSCGETATSQRGHGL